MIAALGIFILKCITGCATTKTEYVLCKTPDCTEEKKIVKEREEKKEQDNTIVYASIAVLLLSTTLLLSPSK